MVLGISMRNVFGERIQVLLKWRFPCRKVIVVGNTCSKILSLMWAKRHTRGEASPSAAVVTTHWQYEGLRSAPHDISSGTIFRSPPDRSCDPESRRLLLRPGIHVHVQILGKEGLQLCFFLAGSVDAAHLPLAKR